MTTVTEQALKDRARSLLMAMTERDRYMYALQRDSLPQIVALMRDLDIPQVDDAAGGSVLRFASEAPRAHFVVFDNIDLNVLLLQGDQEGCVPTMGKILEATGFVPQSKLWGDALNIGTPEATRALKILAHMAIGWDADWTDLFLLHLASPDPIARHDATLSLITAAMVCFEQDAAIELLVEAQSRETFPKLAATMAEGEALLRKLDGQAVELGAMGIDAES